jgi:hypothetical protein
MARALSFLIQTNYFKFVVYLQKITFFFFNLGHTTPAPSQHGSDNEEDDVDEDQELHELGIAPA